MKLIITCLFISTLVLISCNNEPQSNNNKPPSQDQKKSAPPIVPDPQESNKNDTIPSYKKYEIESGVITFNTSMNTLTVDVSYKTVISFDHYGMRERRDTYEEGILTETFLSDGFNNYNISHKHKKIVRTGKAYRGTESKFGWDAISEEDLKAGKVIKDAPTTIAGKKCKVYTILAEVATVSYGGWKNIILLNKVESPGGKSVSVAEKVDINPVDESIFILPKGYDIKG